VRYMPCRHQQIVPVPPQKAALKARQDPRGKARGLIGIGLIECVEIVEQIAWGRGRNR
jgi:hypothetical protein